MNNNMEYNISDAIESVKKKIRDSALKSGRNPEDILLVGVTKTVEVELMRKAFELGIKDFGENKVQEFLKKSDIIDKDCNWHIIGRLQTNKVKYLDKRVKLIHSLDRIELAEALQKKGEKIGYIFPVLVQVNVSGEETKAGVNPDQLIDFILKISKMGNIKVKGLMTMAPYTENPEDVRYVFKNLKKLSVDISRERVENICINELSMGMSNDFTVAIEEGATIVRIGSAIFGTRNYNT
jgi:pyridoxal phosphate enzyme (YggS family)